MDEQLDLDASGAACGCLVLGPSRGFQCGARSEREANAAWLNGSGRVDEDSLGGRRCFPVVWVWSAMYANQQEKGKREERKKKGGKRINNKKTGVHYLGE